MPTRILLKESLPPSHRGANTNSSLDDGGGTGEALRRKAPPPSVAATTTATAVSSPPPAAESSSKPSSHTQRFHSKRRTTSSFRSSLLSPPQQNNASEHFQSARIGGGDSPSTATRQPDDHVGPVAPRRRRRRATNLRTITITTNTNTNTSLGASGSNSAVSRSNHFGSHHTPSYDSTDIRGSPRLLGYVFCLTACAIMLASVIQFYRSRGTVPPEFQSTFDSNRYFVAPTGNILLWWKVWGAMAVSSGGCLLNLVLVLAHFDSRCCPTVWVNFFRDGSRTERTLLVVLMVYWAAGLHINTSSLSVGESQANVFFTTWIALAATVNNFAVWRESSGLSSILLFRQYSRDTTTSWIWTAFFSTILAGAVTDLFIYRDLVTLQFEGQALRVSQQDWTIVLSIVWTEVIVCVAAVVLNEYQVDPYPLPCQCRSRRNKSQNTIYRCVVGWRQVEGLIILIAMGGKYYVVLYYTGVDTVINGLSNAYVGAWGTFFCSVFSFGTWLKENRNITYLVEEADCVRSNRNDAGRPVR